VNRSPASSFAGGAYPISMSPAFSFATRSRSTGASAAPSTPPRPSTRSLARHVAARAAREDHGDPTLAAAGRLTAGRTDGCPSPADPRVPSRTVSSSKSRASPACMSPTVSAAGRSRPFEGELEPGAAGDEVVAKRRSRPISKGPWSIGGQGATRRARRARRRGRARGLQAEADPRQAEPFATEFIRREVLDAGPSRVHAAGAAGAPVFLSRHLAVTRIRWACSFPRDRGRGPSDGPNAC